jgi:hypothetical protein
MNILTEGEEHVFRVEKLVSVSSPDDNFILKGPGGRKFLLPADRYRHYGISPGQNVTCKIDRINCNGRIFLEPQNPHYSAGKSYMFPVKSYGTRVDYSGEYVKVAIVEDIFGNSYPVTADSVNSSGSSLTEISLRVQEISKGRLIFERFKPVRAEAAGSIESGQYRVEGRAMGFDDKYYFVCSGATGSKHLVSEDHYGYYGLKPGDSFRGEIHSGKDGNEYLEPDNPFYAKGMILCVDIVESEPDTVNNSLTLKVTDKYGFFHFISTNDQPAGRTVVTEVHRIKKGKPELRLL